MPLIDTSSEANWQYAQGLGRAFSGAIIFGLPLLMTMEMWWLGFLLKPWMIGQFILVNFLVLIGLSRVSGFEPTFSWFDDLLDAFSAFAVAAFAALLTLGMMGIIVPGMPFDEIVGKVAIQAVPGSFGAMLATKQLGGKPEGPQTKERGTYPGTLFLMLAGALFLAFNVAPTEEMILISFRMSSGLAIGLVLLSIVLLHTLVYTVGFRNEKEPPGGHGLLLTFFRFSIVGYAIVVIASLYILWTFGRTEGVGVPQIASMVAVLSFPAAIGAAIARLVV